MPLPLECPLCGGTLNSFIRIRSNTYVTYCSKVYDNPEHPYIKCEGEDLDKAVIDLRQKCQQHHQPNQQQLIP